MSKKKVKRRRAEVVGLGPTLEQVALLAEEVARHEDSESIHRRINSVKHQLALETERVLSLENRLEQARAHRKVMKAQVDGLERLLARR